MNAWCAESDCSPRRSPEPDRTVYHFVNDLLSGEFFHNLSSLRRNDELCDVVLEASGHSHSGGDTESESAPSTIIAAHKVFPAASCPYFRAMFTSNMVESSRDRIVVMVSSNVTILEHIDVVCSSEDNRVQNLFGILWGSSSEAALKINEGSCGQSSAIDPPDCSLQL
ncbi:hypothetical protein KIN20_030454 [Parelaphostrongylus tenuis]|uniref:BTB domain-containing protein n=1 Tax=Parelaphostrongylus tenuis TaxID=148309 RepID=A0AAD5R419_PARTN|nr:hypothetical protein KIN20_030454 [Parelaphostrongylus tenuis]